MSQRQPSAQPRREGRWGAYRRHRHTDTPKPDENNGAGVGPRMSVYHQLTAALEVKQRRPEMPVQWGTPELKAARAGREGQ